VAPHVIVELWEWSRNLSSWYANFQVNFLSCGCLPSFCNLTFTVLWTYPSERLPSLFHIQSNFSLPFSNCLTILCISNLPNKQYWLRDCPSALLSWDITSKTIPISTSSVSHSRIADDTVPLQHLSYLSSQAWISSIILVPLEPCTRMSTTLSLDRIAVVETQPETVASFSNQETYIPGWCLSIITV